MPHCSCPPSDKTDICSGGKASTREVPPEHIRLVLSIFCRGIPKHTGALGCVKIVYDGDQAAYLRFGACTSYLSTSLSSSRKERLQPLWEPQRNTLHSAMAGIYMHKAFATGARAESQGYTRSVAGCPGAKLPLSTLSLARPRLSEVAARPRAEWGEIQIPHYPELPDPGLLRAQWRAAFGYNFCHCQYFFTRFVN